MKISNHLVQYKTDSEEDLEILNTKSLPVNIRLLKASYEYRKTIFQIIKYMDEHLRTKFEDYNEPRGVAAPNLGFPLRIIGYKKNMATQPIMQYCINPVIIHKGGVLGKTTTNCGSLKLEKAVEISRHCIIDLRFFDMEGEERFFTGVTRSEGGFTIQHEIDQLDGITLLKKIEK